MGAKTEDVSVQAEDHRIRPIEIFRPGITSEGGEGRLRIKLAGDIRVDYLSLAKGSDVLERGDFVLTDLRVRGEQRGETRR